MPLTHSLLPEEQRLLDADARRANWQRWGPYLSERQWGTVREDYSADGNAWEYFTHEQAIRRAYRWGEDGLLGFCDRQCRLCFGLALWNGCDPILKERLFGLTGPEGNHAEDVKECYYYLDATPTYSYVKCLYKYPQLEFPYQRLRDENRRRGRRDREFELIDTGIFDQGRYFDVLVEYAKAAPEDILVRITIDNRSSADEILHLLPTFWFRNTWIWGCTHEGCEVKPRLQRVDDFQVDADHVSLGSFRLFTESSPTPNGPALLFTENETNSERLFGQPNVAPFVKDAFHDYVIRRDATAVNRQGRGTKMAWHYVLSVPAQGSAMVKLRWQSTEERSGPEFGASFDETFAQRRHEADAYFATRDPEYPRMTAEERQVARQAYAGLLCTKQFYHYAIREWLDGDPDQPRPPASRRQGRNHEWPHLFNRDVISMPDKWEYPWYAAWDLAFHMLPMARVDGNFAKEQLLLLLREWYMHPNGQIPAYEFALGDVNPPVHAWACWRVYKMTGCRGERDVLFLQRAFHKLLLNFTWWVNRKDPHGKNLFTGGFLGLDNIGVFDRSQPLPTGGNLEQADGTAWMAFYCSTMLSIALELADHDPSYEDIASKFFEHFVAITDAMNGMGGCGLWDEEDGFYYDVLQVDGTTIPLRIRSMVGIIPLFAVDVLEQDVIERLPGFKKRLDWFLRYRPDLADQIAYCDWDKKDGKQPDHRHRLLAIPSRERLQRVLRYVLDENEFLSPFGVRALSRYHRDRPYVFQLAEQQYRVGYVPGESDSSMFGGNSNWRGPVWFPVNYLLIEALQRYHYFYGDRLRVECPVGSGRMLTLKEVAGELSMRLTRLFLPTESGQRPCHGTEPYYASDAHWRDLILFHEYFDGDTGRGLGASHQTGWTALVVNLLHDIAATRVK